MVTSPRTSVPSVPNDDLMGSVPLHIPGGKSRLHICIPSVSTRCPPHPPFLWKKKRRFRRAPPPRLQPPPACNSWRSHPLRADVDGATAGSCACNQIPALDAVGHDAEKKYAVQKRNKYTEIFGFAGVECLMFETSVLLGSDLFSSTPSFTSTKHVQSSTEA